MSTTPSVRYLEARMAKLEQELEEALEREARFGSDADYPNQTVISWEQRFESSRSARVYTFVALKVAGAWYTTSLFQHERMTLDELIQKHLSKADSINIVSAWEEL